VIEKMGLGFSIHNSGNDARIVARALYMETNVHIQNYLFI